MKSTRRQVIIAGVGALALARFGAAQAQARDRIEAVRKLIGGAKVETTGLVLDLPMLSEDGSSISLSLAPRADFPLGEASHIRSVHLFAARNPTAEIASYELSPLMGRFQLSTRIRLNETQHVIAVARTSQGVLYAAEREVRITTSGCLARPSGAEGGSEMQVRVRLPQKLKVGAPAEVITMISHPMDTGLAPDANGKTIPQRIIKSFEANYAGAPLIRATYYRSLAANPYLRFVFAPKGAGRLEMKWIEDSGKSAQYSGDIAVG